MRGSLVIPALMALPVCWNVAAAAEPALRLHGLFRDGAVVQCERKLPVYGWAAPGTEVKVSLAGQSAVAKAGDDGCWRVELESLAPGGPHTLVVSGGERTVEVKDLLAGEVWIASGQSNMVAALAHSVGGEEAIAAADLPNVRFFQVPERRAHDPLDDAGGEWVRMSPQTAPPVSAVAFYFARRLHRQLGRPVGVIQAGRGASRLREWMNEAAWLADLSDEERAKLCAEWDEKRKGASEAIAKANEILAERDRLMEQKLRELETVPVGRPRKQLERKIDQEVESKLGKMPDVGSHPRWLYNGMVAPLTGYGVRGVVWWQGEWDAWMKGFKAAYGYEFKRMIRGWRKDFGRDDLPFLFVQLQSNKVFGGKNYPAVREGQRKALALPHTGMAVTIDVCDGLHPGDKAPVGERLSLWAEAKVYGREVVCSGPLFKAAAPEGGALRLSFEHVDGGLVAKGGKLIGFEIAGDDLAWRPAEATIDGKTVVVRAEGLAKPVHVRYAYEAVLDPKPTLYNQAGLPASPFTTEDVVKVPRKRRGR